MSLSSPLQKAELEAQSSLHTNQDTPSHANATTNAFDTGALQVGIQKMHLSPPNSPKRGIHKLPVELVLKIIEFLPAEKAREFREVSGLWGAGGTTVFFPGGICKLRPHRRDTEHLHYLLTLKASQYFANRIENIKIYAGDMNMARWAYLIKRTEMERIPSKDDLYFDDLTGTAISEMYERWNTLQALDDRLSPGHCDFQLLSAAFEKLPKVRHLSIISVDFPLPSEWENEGTKSSDLIVYKKNNWDCLIESWGGCVREAWHTGTIFQDPTLAFQRYTNIMLAAQAAEWPLKSLVLDSLPIECFPREPKQDPINPRWHAKHIETSVYDRIKGLFIPLETIRIVLSGSDLCFPYTDPTLGVTMGHFFGSMQNLRSLDFTWLLPPFISPAVLDSWNATFYNITWPHLESLRLTWLADQMSDLKKLLDRHARTLRRLSLGGVPLKYQQTRTTRTFRDLFGHFRDNFRLKRFEIMIEGVPGTMPLYDGDWKRIRYPNEPILNKQFEDYIVRGEEWPFSTDDPE